MPYSIIFKNGDDLRQDQLVIQMFHLFDSLLKNVNVDLYLQPYRVLACSKADGFLEMVTNSENLSVLALILDYPKKKYHQRLSRRSSHQNASRTPHL